MLDVRPGVEAALIGKVVQHLLRHHDMLRLRGVETTSGYRLFIADADDAVPFTHVDGAALADLDHAPAAEAAFIQNMRHAAAYAAETGHGDTLEAIAAQLQGSLSLSHGPLMRVAFFDFGPHRPGRLLLCVHHFAVDGVSLRILLEDLHTGYEQLSRGEPIHLPAKTTSFKHWAHRLSEYAHSDALQREAPFWLAPLQTPLAELPVDDPGAKMTNTVASSRVRSTALSVEETRPLVQDAPTC